jgi:hypothetical protein
LMRTARGTTPYPHIPFRAEFVGGVRNVRYKIETIYLAFSNP